MTTTDVRCDTATEEEFLALVLSDEELVRAEFDAIVAAQWGALTPDPVERDDDGEPPAQPPQVYPGGYEEPLPTRRPDPPLDRWRRQRSPPLPPRPGSTALGQLTPRTRVN